MKKKLNDGEREEYLIKIYLCYLRDSKIDLPIYVMNLDTLKSLELEIPSSAANLIDKD